MLCTICDSATDYFGSVDFNRSGNDFFEKKRLFPVSDVKVPYYRCAQCGFIATDFFENWSDEDYRAKIYNTEYVLADPPFEEARPASLSQYLEGVLKDFRDTVTLLDYGCGNGKLVQKLIDLGFVHVKGYDPLNKAGSAPSGQYDVVFSFEVVEHVLDQKKLFSTLFDYISPNGILLISTLMQPKDIKQLGAGWWYMCPRNGHMSFHTEQSLSIMAQKYGYRILSLSDELHIAFRQSNDWVARFKASALPKVNTSY